MKITNIILYSGDEVMGFVEIKQNQARVQHNFEGDLLLTINDDVFSMDGREIYDVQIEDGQEVFVSIARRDDGLEILASGIVNQANTPNTKVNEIDKMLREACSFADEGLNACKKCPYREEFFKFKIEA